MEGSWEIWKLGNGETKKLENGDIGKWGNQRVKSAGKE
jgi:hypothetical protein